MSELAARVDRIASEAFEAGLGSGATILAQMAALLRSLEEKEPIQDRVERELEPTFYYI